jgi:thiosulfate/3-mercaptopyruvate sulfurtransferase
MSADPFVSTAWIADRLGGPGVRIVDASWHMPAESRSGAAEFVDRHIPGAVFFDIDAIADRTLDLPHMLPSPQAFAAAAGRLGLPREARIVVYEAPGAASAGRVWWTLRAMGYPDVMVLDGGLTKWLAEGRPVEAGEASPSPVTVEPRYDAALVRDLEAVRAALASGDAQVVDARPAARFRGEAPEPRAGLRGGHMPGARNLPWSNLANPDGTMKSAPEIRAAFESAGLDLGRPIVATCGSGVTAAFLALALARLGLDRAAVYDGSWAEWGGRADTPVETGPAR